MEKAVEHQVSINVGRFIYPFAVYGYVFLYMYTGYDKLTHLDTFTQGIGHIPYLGMFAEYIGWGIPLLEIVIALLLILPRTQAFALKLSVGLMGIFTLYLAWMLLFVENRLCHCGGVIQSMGWTEHLVFNLLWLLLGLWAIRIQNNNKLFNIQFLQL